MVTFKNNTEFELVRDSKKCLEGVWKNDPPPKINPKEEVVFRSEAKAGLSGTDAAVIYVLKGTKNTLTLEWSNPFVGNPKFVYKNPSSISVDVQKREGNNFLVDFVLNPPGQTSVRGSYLVNLFLTISRARYCIKHHFYFWLGIIQVNVNDVF